MEDEDVVDVRRHDWNDRGGGVEHLFVLFLFHPGFSQTRKSFRNIALVRSTTTTTIGPDGYDRYPQFTDDDAIGGAGHKDGTCVVQSGAWPHDALVIDDDELFRSKAPYTTCFVWYDNNVATKYCWSRSYLTKGGDWKPCKPKGYGSDGWTELEQCDSEDDDSDDKSVVTNNCCGTPCTEFEKT